MDMGGGGREKDKDPGLSLTPLVRPSVCLCARAACAYAYTVHICVYVGFLRISTFASGSLRFSGKLLPPHKKEKTRPVHVC